MRNHVGVAHRSERHTLLEEKLALLRQYLSSTVKIRAILTGKREEDVKMHLQKREECIQKIREIDKKCNLELKRVSNNVVEYSDDLKENLGKYQHQIIEIIERTLIIEQEITNLIREERDSLLREILTMRNKEKAHSGYRGGDGYFPKFLHTSM